MSEEEKIIEKLKGNPMYLNYARSKEELDWLISAKDKDPAWWYRMTSDSPGRYEFERRMDVSSFY